MKLKLLPGRRSTTLKLFVVALLILVLLVPVGMIKGLVMDRIQVESSARSDIRESWGGAQVVAGPILRLPFKDQGATSFDAPFASEHVAHIVAESLKSEVSVTTELRYRGIHEVPVYVAHLVIFASFNLDELDGLNVDETFVDWSAAELLLGITDAIAIQRMPKLEMAAAGDEFYHAAGQIAGLPPQLAANVGEAIEAERTSGEFNVKISFAINGSESLQFLPLANRADVAATANWPSPSFDGRHLPTTREISETGFSAHWATSSLARRVPVAWVDNQHTPSMHQDGLFGVRFMQPLGLYQVMFRALNYAVLFIGLTFVIYFLVETLGALKLHPLQYLLVGFANTLFYLLLLSFAEHLGFAVAYFLSAVASIALIAGYSASVLCSRRRAAHIGIALVGLYVFLYLTLTTETVALLAGSIGLWIVLAITMYLTRNTNWYATTDVD